VQTGYDYRCHLDNGNIECDMLTCPILHYKPWWFEEDEVKEVKQNVEENKAAEPLEANTNDEVNESNADESVN
jgi:hypothetical protein